MYELKVAQFLSYRVYSIKKQDDQNTVQLMVVRNSFQVSPNLSSPLE